MKDTKYTHFLSVYFFSVDGLNFLKDTKYTHSLSVYSFSVYGSNFFERYKVAEKVSQQKNLLTLHELGTHFLSVFFFAMWFELFEGYKVHTLSECLFFFGITAELFERYKVAKRSDSEITC